MFKKIVAFLIFLTFLSCSKEEQKEIIYNISASPTTIDPHLYRDALSVQLLTNVYSGLLRNGNELDLAESIEEEGNKLIITLKDNIKWSDGTDITVEDFIYSFRRVLNPKTASRYAELLYPIKNAKSFNESKLSEEELGVYEDNNKLVIELEQKVPYFKYILSQPISFPVKKGQIEDIADYTKAVYSGAYKIDFMNSDEIKLVKNDNYWNANSVSIPLIKFIAINDFSVVENLIKNNELDLSRVESIDLETKKKNNELLQYSNGRVWYLDFNLQNEILNKLENRIAIRDAIDRVKYVEDIKNDGSIVSKSVISEIITDYRKLFPDDNYFEDNKYSDVLKGKSLRLLASNSSPEIKEAHFIQEELRVKLGLKVDVTIVSYKDRLALTRANDYDIVLNTYSPKFDDPVTMLERWYKPEKDGYGAWRKKEYESLVEESYNIEDKQKRYEIMNEAEKILIDDAVISPLYYSAENWFVRKGIKGIEINRIANTMDMSKLK